MKWQPLPIEGAALIELSPFSDERGLFSRLYCKSFFESNGLSFHPAQINHSTSNTQGTLRGLHYQLSPFEEIKVVTCLQGEIFDVILDLRKESPTFEQHYSLTLSSEKREALLVPKGCAHGFLTLQENTDVLYFVSAPYSPSHEKGIRYNDPKYRISWPFNPLVISEKDQTHPLAV